MASDDIQISITGWDLYSEALNRLSYACSVTADEMKLLSDTLNLLDEQDSYDGRVKCVHCGQYGEQHTACVYCGAPID